MDSSASTCIQSRTKAISGKHEKAENDPLAKGAEFYMTLIVPRILSGASLSCGV